MARQIIILVYLAAMITGCGSSSNSLNDNIQTFRENMSTLSVLVKDNLSLDYREVWIRLLKVEAIDINDQIITLYDNPDGRVFNLASTDTVAALLSARSIPAGNYKTLRITLASELTLVDKNGSQTTHKFTNASDTLTLSIPTDLQTIADKVASLALDFDIAQLVINQANEITPEVKVITDTSSSIDRIIAEIEGKVVSILDNHQFTLQPTGSNINIDVQLHSTGVVTNEITKQNGIDFSSLVIDDKVGIFGNFNSNGLVLEAVSVSVNGDTPSSGNANQVINKTVKVEGIINSLNNNALELNVHEASFIPQTDVMTIIDLSNAFYQRGNQTMLATGQQVEIKGTWDGQQLTAKHIEIEGAHIETSDSGSVSDSELAEVKGTVSQIQNTLLTIQVEEAEHINLTGNTLSIDIKEAWFKHGNIDCLTNGTKVEIKGSVSTDGNNTLSPTVIEVKSHCTTLPNESSSDDGSSNDVPLSSTGVQAYGLIQSIEGDKITLQTTKTEHFSPTGNTIEVIVTNTTSFEHGTKNDLTQNASIKVEGTWNGQALTAVKIEFSQENN